MAEDEKSSRLPLSGKRFFIDPKVDTVIAKKIRQNLLLLGGVSTIFCSKYICIFASIYT